MEILDILKGDLSTYADKRRAQIGVALRELPYGKVQSEWVDLLNMLYGKEHIRKATNDALDAMGITNDPIAKVAVYIELHKTFTKRLIALLEELLILGDDTTTK